ncbi:hypothetical protein LGH82_18935 [Mesorhizobium sp. PAMC28654]|uniref:hypothetical protein n=1 Tax=Mesorhizobium sp. PAMC28654 TaxID=2880934 RepID=UPI001D0AEE7E|nr:hypothetical protein [Mesorhizobium sp. PAMC28654]UDL87271.1 hypothetical protein LGH82_18935 [Mesorhizobium sp. PAMC28654]
MPQKFDPTVSSADYLAIARKRHSAGRSKIYPDLKWMLVNAAFDFGIQPRHVDLLLDPLGWSELVIQQKRTPRVFLDARVNQSGNAEIVWARGDKGILYEEDFVRPYLHAAQSPSEGPGRGIGEVMWAKGFERLVANAAARQCPAATALLFGFAARLNELAAVIAEGVDLVGAMKLEFRYLAAIRPRLNSSPPSHRNAWTG